MGDHQSLLLTHDGLQELILPIPLRTPAKLHNPDNIFDYPYTFPNIMGLR
jgi:hypothetical protein